MERKVGEVFNDDNDRIKVVESIDCVGCYYKGKKCCDSDNVRYSIAGKCARASRGDNNPVKFIKIGESKMDNKEELKRSLAEEEQRAKDSLANVEKMKKQLEELNKKEVEVSATGVLLSNTDNEFKYTVYGNNGLGRTTCNEPYGRGAFEINNIFATEKQASQEALRREGQEFIRRCAMLWNKGNDWRKKKDVRQLYVDFDTTTNKLGIEYNTVYTGGAVYFDSGELAEKCISELKAKYNEEQIKNIFGVI